jgi:AcrR family transcriptional regulator
MSFLMGLLYHNGMSVPYQAQGRVQQKQRTREALVAATRALLREGRTPTVEEAGAAASVSRTTAYRYFPTQRDLLVATHPEIDRSSMLGDDAPTEVAERFAAVLDEIERQIVENEATLRTMLRLSLEHPDEREGLLLRQGRRQVWIEDALSPLHSTLEPASFRRLVLAITSATGIESFVWLTDVGGLDRREALAVMRYSGSTLLASASS